MKLGFDQMMDHWRRAQGLEEKRLDCSVELFEGVDASARMAVEMRQWYLRLMDSGPLEVLVVRDIAGRLGPFAFDGRGWRTQLPADVRRAVSVTAAGSAAVPVWRAGYDDDRIEAFLRRADNPWLRGSVASPVAIAAAGYLTVYAGTAPVTVTSFLAVTDPGEETFEFDEKALSLIPGAQNG